MNRLPGIYIDTDHPHLSTIFDMIDSGVLLYDNGIFNIPSQLHRLSNENIGILLNGGLIRIFITDWLDPESGQLKMFTNKEDIEILRNYVNEGDTFAEKVQRNCALITRCKIRYDSKDKEMMKIFWKNYFQHTLN